MDLPCTLPDLLQARAVHSIAQLTFLNDDGNVSKAISYADLLHSASMYARRLLAAGLTQSDVVLASFADHESHIYLFWACCLAGIPVCPLPALHPDPGRQSILFNHLQAVFHKPTLIASAETTQKIHALVPGLKFLIPEKLPVAAADTLDRVFPHHKPSPSDNVCFMLTSGSMGNSKAVSLRHSNLLSSIRGKIRHHGTTADSRFLNWIAFDHVACASEVHLQALEANASQWHVSPSAIIRNPLNLLKLASMFKITYTFSPNFLLAAILRDLPEASFDEPLNFSDLQALISGGEAVPMRTAVAVANALQSFGARRDVLRAGFGMSETGAGCIYDTRPIPDHYTLSSSKYLSLGRCCPGIEMRIVDSNTRELCLPGAIGQLQVSGPTVFTEYYGNSRATTESFTDDGWFVTGDLAQLDEDGNLFLVGRDKDCININGVKYPTLDVEHYVEDAKIEGVIPHCLYVCPMRLIEAETETYGVFYQHHCVVEVGLNSTQKRGIASTNRLIRDVCTVFCSQPPHIILPLPRSSFFKTTLGKVSRSYLSTCYLDGKFDGLQVTLTTLDDLPLDDAETFADGLVNPVEQAIAEIISYVFSVDISSLRRSQSLFDIGASSMHLLRLKQVIKERLSLHGLPTIEILKRPKIGLLCDYLSVVISAERQGGKQVTVEYNPIVCMNTSGSKPPLFLIHPGVGEVLIFVALARKLSDDRPVYALRARGFDNGDPTFDTFKEMVECYVSWIERVYPYGQYNIAGYSYGGAVAFEIGKSLEAKGKDVSFLGILNLPPYIKSRMNELSWAEVLLNIGMFLSLIPSSDLSLMRKELRDAFPGLAANDMKPLATIGPIDWLFKRANKQRLLELDLDIDVFTRWVNVAYEINRTGRTFEPQGCVKNALTCVFCAIPLPSMGTREEYKQNRLSLWKEFSGRSFEMVDVDGEHYTMLSEEHVDSFSAHMRAALLRAESRGQALEFLLK